MPSKTPNNSAPESKYNQTRQRLRRSAALAGLVAVAATGTAHAANKAAGSGETRGTTTSLAQASNPNRLTPTQFEKQTNARYKSVLEQIASGKITGKFANCALVIENRGPTKAPNMKFGVFNRDFDLQSYPSHTVDPGWVSIIDMPLLVKSGHDTKIIAMDPHRVDTWEPVAGPDKLYHTDTTADPYLLETASLKQLRSQDLKIYCLPYKGSSVELLKPRLGLPWIFPETMPIYEVAGRIEKHTQLRLDQLAGYVKNDGLVNKPVPLPLP